MLVKIIRNGRESEWIYLTKSQHRALLKQQPQAVMVHIDDLYPNSPDAGRIVTLPFPVFTVIARDAILEENRLKKREQRFHDRRSLDNIDPREYSFLFVSIEEELLRREQQRRLRQAWKILTPTQQRRLKMFVEDDLSVTQIAEIELVHHTAISDNLRAARKKLLKFLSQDTSRNRDFLSD